MASVPADLLQKPAVYSGTDISSSTWWAESGPRWPLCAELQQARTAISASVALTDGGFASSAEPEHLIMVRLTDLMET